MSIPKEGIKIWRVHPGEILLEEFMKPMGMSSYELAKRLLVPAHRINDIVLERRGVTADTAIRLSRLFSTTEQFWLNLQGAYEVSRAKAERGAELERIEPLKSVEARVGLYWTTAEPRSAGPTRACSQSRRGICPYVLFSGRGHLATTTVESPPRGRKSPFTSADTGFAQRTTSSNTRFTIFSWKIPKLR